MKIHGTAKGGALSKKDFGVAFGGAAAQVVSGENLKAYWRFNQASGDIENIASTVANNDSLGDSADLTNNDITLGEAGSPTNLGTNALFDGSTSYGQAQAGSESNFNFFFDGSSFTISYWYKSTAAFTVNQHIVDTKNSSESAGDYGLDIRTNPTYRFRANLADNGAMGDFRSDDNFVPDSTDFYNYVLTWNNSTTTFKWFRDGVEHKDGSGNAGSAGGTSNYVMVVGAYSDSPPNLGMLKGNLLELAIWERVLTDEEIVALYNSGNGLVLT